ncbi:MAG TPA: hypothetical protein EYG92_06980, partial [Lutibacter sp.]|nr:hypothetical protein [Lutibacter sp.]
MFSNKNKKQKAASAAKKANFNFSTQGGKTSQSARLKTSTIVIVLLVAVISSALITGSTMYHFMTENKTAINNGKTRSVSYTKYDNGNISDDSNANWREEIKPETVHEYPELFKKGMKRKKYDNNIIKKGEIKWQQPEDIGDLGFTSKKMYEGCFGECDIKGFTSGGIKYYKVGKIIEGEFKDRDIVVIKSSIHGGGPGGTGIDITRALVTGEDVIFMVDEKDGWTVNQLNEIFIQGEINKVMADVSIEELTYPKKLKWNDEKGGAITFARNKYDKAFFTSDKLRLAFTHPSYRQIFTTDTNLSRDSKPTKFKLNHRLGYNHKTKIIEEVYIDIFNKNGFYIKAPDGTAVSYKMNFSIFDKPETTHGVLQAVWSDGEKNTIKYGLNCGEYVCDKTAEIKKSNLEIVGKMDQGGKIYTYKDTTHPDLQKMHKDEYWVKGDEPKKNIHDFLKMRPQIFWEDPFGRLLVFTRQDIVSPAEMGKPVIYLYPEEEMEVNVQ